MFQENTPFEIPFEADDKDLKDVEKFKKNTLQKLYKKIKKWAKRYGSKALNIAALLLRLLESSFGIHDLAITNY